jgi:twitching motility protein PilU
MSLFDLYESGQISYEDALRSADSMNELRLKIKLEGKHADQHDTLGSVNGLSIITDDNP